MSQYLLPSSVTVATRIAGQRAKRTTIKDAKKESQLCLGTGTFIFPMLVTMFVVATVTTLMAMFVMVAMVRKLLVFAFQCCYREGKRSKNLKRRTYQKKFRHGGSFKWLRPYLSPFSRWLVLRCPQRENVCGLFACLANEER